MIEPFPWKQTLIVAAAALMAFASLALSVWMSLKLQTSIAAVQAVGDLRRQYMMIGTALREAEAAQRMYVITGEEAHLAPLAGVQLSIRERWRRAEEAAAHVTGFSFDTTELEEASIQSLEMLQTTAEIRRSSGREVSMERVLTGESWQRLVAVHMRLQAVMEQLEGLAEAETRALAQDESRGRTASLASGLVAMGLGGLGIWQWGQSLTHYGRELELKAQKSRAEQMARDKRDFLASMGHEVRTPLNAILGMSEQLGSMLPRGTARSQAEAIFSAGKDMLRLVNDLLDLSRMEAGRLELVKTPVSMSAQALWARSFFEHLAREKGIRLECAANADLPDRVMMDEGRFRQIVMNLLGNALKFTPPGGFVSLKLERAEIMSGDELVIEVKDTGQGIPPNRKARIFLPYVQGEPASRKEGESGTGLGLAIVRQLVLLMDGEISLQSQPGKGSTFRITLPLEAAARDAPTDLSDSADTRVASAPGAAAVTPAEPLKGKHAASLRGLLREKYAVALATQSTADVENLASALDSIGGAADVEFLRTTARRLREASSTFSLQSLTLALQQLPQKLAPYLAGENDAAPNDPQGKP